MVGGVPGDIRFAADGARLPGAATGVAATSGASYGRRCGPERRRWSSYRSIEIGSYPAALIVNTSVSAGYSHRITATPVGGLYFGAWVQGPDGAQDIYYRFYED